MLATARAVDRGLRRSHIVQCASILAVWDCKYTILNFPKEDDIEHVDAADEKLSTRIECNSGWMDDGWMDVRN